MRKQTYKETNRKIRIAPFVAIFIFLVLGAIGISLGEPTRVLQQATQICLSCIGIG
ncbi:MAG: CD1871A family CXXC motif-containing protein [Desulforhopalus sp.]